MTPENATRTGSDSEKGAPCSPLSGKGVAAAVAAAATTTPAATATATAAPAAATETAAAAAATEIAAAEMGTTQSQYLKDGNARLFWGVCAVAGAAAVFYLTSNRRSSSKRECTDEEIVDLLQTVTKDFHRIFADAAQ